MSISANVVIMTQDELLTYRNEWFDKGVKRGRFEERCDQSQAKATEGKAGNAEGTPLVRQTTTGTGLQVGEAVAVQPATSEIMDVTAGETAPSSSDPAQEPEAVAPFGYLFAKAGENGYYFVGPPEFASVESRFQHIYTPVYTRPVSLDREALARSLIEDRVFALQSANDGLREFDDKGAECKITSNLRVIDELNAILAKIEGRT